MDAPADDAIAVTTRSLEDANTTVREVRLSRPEKHNALSLGTLAALADLFGSVGTGDGSAVVVAAAGEDFSLGADVADLDPAALSDPGVAADRVQDLVASLRACPLPVVARVQGRAYGAGFLLCLGVDLVVAAENATFAVPEADIGIPVAGFATTLLPQLVGERRAREWLFTGRSVGAEAAARAGFVTETAPPADLDATLDRLLGSLAGSSTDAVAALKGQLAPVATPTDETVRATERAAMQAAYEEGDVTERLQDLL